MCVCERERKADSIRSIYALKCVQDMSVGVYLYFGDRIELHLSKFASRDILICTNKFGYGKIFTIEVSSALLLYFFDQKYSKNSNIVKYYNYKTQTINTVLWLFNVS